MTLLGSVIEGDTVYVATDSLVVSSDGRRFVNCEKFHKLNSMLGAGWFGTDDVGQLIFDDLQGMSFANWDELRGSLTSLTKVANRKDDRFAASMMVAGIVDNTPGIMVADHMGWIAPRHEPFAFAGAWGTNASDVLKFAAGGERVNSSMLVDAVTHVVTEHQFAGVDLPIHVYKLNAKDGSQRIDKLAP